MVIKVIQFDGIDGNTRLAYIAEIQTVDSSCIISSEGSLTCDELKNNLLLEDTLFNAYIDSRDELVMQDYKNMYNILQILFFY